MASVKASATVKASGNGSGRGNGHPGASVTPPYQGREAAGYRDPIVIKANNAKSPFTPFSVGQLVNVGGGKGKGNTATIVGLDPRDRYIFIRPTGSQDIYRKEGATGCSLSPVKGKGTPAAKAATVKQAAAKARAAAPAPKPETGTNPVGTLQDSGPSIFLHSAN